MKLSSKTVSGILTAAVGTCVFSSVSAATSQTDVAAQLKQVSAQTAQLQKQVSELKAQLHKSATHTAGGSLVSKPAHSTKVTKHGQRRQGLLRYMSGVTVSTSPILGLRSKYDASDLVVNISSMNEDLRLLSQRRLLEKVANDHGYTYAQKPFVVLSGALEGQALAGNDFNHDSSSDIDLDTAELDVEPVVSPWAAGFMSLQYDDSSPATGSRTGNSRFYLQRGFLTIGDLNRAPVYFTLGQMYAPFGRYSSNMVTNPITKSIGRTLTREALFGYADHGFYAEAYGYRGDVRINSAKSSVNEGGGNIGIKRAYSHGDYDIGAGLISNLGDSQGAQNTGYGVSGAFGGFSVNKGAGSDLMVHRVPAANVHASADIGNWTVITEYVGATRRFNSQDLTFNNRGASPKAMDAELVYNFAVKNRPTNLGFMYDQSWQALGLNVPRQSFTVAMNTSIWKDTIESLEFRHDNNYQPNDTATGRISTNTTGTNVNLGPYHSRNLYTLQVGVYF